MGRTSREKGMRGELEAARYWRLAFPACARRAAGEEAQDTQGRDLKGTPGFCVQVKTEARPQALAALREAAAAAGPGEIPFAHLRVKLRGQRPGAPAEPPFVVLRAWDLLWLIVVLQEAQACTRDRPVLEALNRMAQARADGHAA